MEFWLDIAAFALKALLIVAAIVGLAALIARISRDGSGDDNELKITSLNDHYDDLQARLNSQLQDAKTVKAERKARRKAEKNRPAADDRKRLYVMEFDGDLKASTHKQLTDMIDALLTVARPGTDEIVIKIESPGGLVTGYGLAAMQLLRIREAKLALTVCVDQVAASGGYLMACTADKILAAPFAVVGSIGVIAQVPNLHRLLKKNDIDYEEITAGEFKRTVSMLGEITPAGREHFREKLDATHVAFKDFVAKYRPGLAIDKVANGDFWYGSEAVALGLVDALQSSDDYLFRARGEARMFRVSIEEKKTLLQQLLESVGFVVTTVATRLFRRIGPAGL